MWQVLAPSQLPNRLLTDVFQVCIVTDDFCGTIERLSDQLGIGPFHRVEFRPPLVLDLHFEGKPSELTLRLGITLVGRMQWEVIQPLSGDSLGARCLAQRGPSAHHIAVATGRVGYRQAQRRLEAAGLPWVQHWRMLSALELGPFTLPRPPERLAGWLSLQAGYAQAQGSLGLDLELMQTPLGLPINALLRRSVPDARYPDYPGAPRDIRAMLPNHFVDDVVKLGIVTRDLDARVRSWSERVGVGPWCCFTRGPDCAEGTSAARVAWAPLGAVLLEIRQPLSADSPLGRALADQGEGIDSIGVVSRRLGFDAARRHLLELDFELEEEGQVRGVYGFARFDTRAAIGTRLELVAPTGRPPDALRDATWSPAPG